MFRLTAFAIAFFGLLTFSIKANAAPAQYAFRINFTDKAGAPIAAAANTFLSAKALARRSKFSIVVDSIDRPISPFYLDSALSLTNGKVHVVSKWMNSAVLLLEDSSKITMLNNKSWVASILLVGIFPDGLHKGLVPSSTNTTKFPEPTPLPISPLANKSTGYSFFYDKTWNQTNMVHGDYLHDKNLLGKGILIALLDVGFRGFSTHEVFDSMLQNNRLVDVHNFYENNAQVDDYSQHGTTVLSTIAGYVPGTYIGSAPEANIALYVTEINTGELPIELDQYIAGLERADSIGADVINASLGYADFSIPFSNQSYAIQELDGKTTIVARAVNIANSRGIVVVTSAGNEGDNSWGYLLTPGDADDGLSVGAVQPNRLAADLSSPGPNYAGVTKPDVCMQGDPTAIAFDGNTYGTASGTSFAAPQLAGYVACILQGNPNTKPNDLRLAVQKSADRYAQPSPKLGYGIPDFSKVLEKLGIVDFSSSKQKIVELTAYPNPFTDKIEVLITTKKPNTQLNFVLYDLLGKVVYKQAIKATVAGEQTIQLSTPKALAAGSYFLEVNAESWKGAAVLIKQ